MRDGTTVLESRSDAEFARVQQVLREALVAREEVVFVELDPQYFLRGARERGDSADRLYVERQTDSSGCTTFGRFHQK